MNILNVYIIIKNYYIIKRIKKQMNKLLNSKVQNLFKRQKSNRLGSTINNRIINICRYDLNHKVFSVVVKKHLGP